jgi:hypothetical protein
MNDNELWEQAEHDERHAKYRRLAAAEARVKELEAFIAELPDKIRRSGEPGPGGINITDGIPSVTYIGIGRDRYDDEYEVAKAAAEEVREGNADYIEHLYAALRPANQSAAPSEGE